LLKIIPLRDEYLEDAAALVSDRFRQLLKQEPMLPARYTEVQEILPFLRNLSKIPDLGVVANRGGRLVQKGLAE